MQSHCAQSTSSSRGSRSLIQTSYTFLIVSSPCLATPRLNWPKLSAVLGDSGKLYVSEDCVSAYRQMLPLATIITPNWFEVEYVS